MIAGDPVTADVVGRSGAATTDLRLLLPAAVGWAAAGILVGCPTLWLSIWSPCVAVGALVLATAAASVAVWHARRHSPPQPTLFAPPQFALPQFAPSMVAPSVRGSHRRQRTGTSTVLATLAATLAAVGLVSASAAAHVPRRVPSILESMSGHTVEIDAVVTSGATSAAGSGAAGSSPSFRFTVTASALSTGTRLVGVSVPLLVFLRAPTPSTAEPSASRVSSGFPIGSAVSMTGTIRATDPGESAAALVFLDDPPVVNAGAPWFFSWAEGLRAPLRSSAEKLPGTGGQLVPGLALGDVGLVSVDLDAAMKSSGLSHLTAVSGANCAIVVQAIMLLGGVVRLNRRGRIVASLAVMTAFVVLVTPSASVLRAAVMAAIVLCTLASGRSPRGLPALSFAVVVLLVIDPWQSRSYGLALSVLATGGLLLLTRPLQLALQRVLPRSLALVIAVPTAAQLACQPVLVLLAPSIPTYSVVANLLAEPAAPVATVIGLTACLVGAIVPALSLAGAWLTWAPASWIGAVATYFAGLPGSSIPWVGGLPGVALTLLVVAAGLTVLFVRPDRALGRPHLARAGLTHPDDIPNESTRSDGRAG